MFKVLKDLREGVALGMRLSRIAAAHQGERELPQLLRAELARSDRVKTVRYDPRGRERTDDDHPMAA
jgi:hypothetical protein